MKLQSDSAAWDQHLKATCSLRILRAAIDQIVRRERRCFYTVMLSRSRIEALQSSGRPFSSAPLNEGFAVHLSAYGDESAGYGDYRDSLHVFHEIVQLPIIRKSCADSRAGVIQRRLEHEKLHGGRLRRFKIVQEHELRGVFPSDLDKRNPGLKVFLRILHTNSQHHYTASLEGCFCLASPEHEPHDDAAVKSSLLLGLDSFCRKKPQRNLQRSGRLVTSSRRAPRSQLVCTGTSTGSTTKVSFHTHSGPLPWPANDQAY